MGFEPTKHKQQILSLSPLTARETKFRLTVLKNGEYIYTYTKLLLYYMNPVLFKKFKAKTKYNYHNK